MKIKDNRFNIEIDGVFKNSREIWSCKAKWMDGIV